MSGLAAFWAQTDGIGRAVALLLLCMSIGAWVLIFWKSWQLNRVRADLQRCSAAFWDAPTWADGRQRLVALDREATLLPLVDAMAQAPLANTLEAASDAEAQATRRLRNALHSVVRRLQGGQVFLASVGATAPFVGLFGTVWGIYHALLGMADSGGLRLEQIAGPVGEALIMTAAGLAVAIPAVLGYNVFGKWIGGFEADLEGLAHDLRALGGRPGVTPSR